MASRFIALPVGQGDSFYLERPQGSVLFDGGKSKRLLPQLIDKHIGKRKIDVVICSHNDSDHTEGIIGILKNDHFEVAEVWLPGKWREGIERLASMHPLGVIRQLWSEVPERDAAENFEKLGERMSGEIRGRFQDRPRGYFEACLKEVSRPKSRKMKRVFRVTLRLFASKNQMLLDAIEAADRIVEIAALAYRKADRVRWFDYDEFSRTNLAQGGNDWLRPINSVEVTYSTQTDVSLLRYLALTTANKQSLIFHSRVDEEPSVVFSADSDLSGVILTPPSEPKMIVTAPHHGSEANGFVYGKFPLATWIRSDSKTKLRPGKTYLAQQDRYCTRCRKSRKPKVLEFLSANQVWSPIHGLQSCSC